MDKPRGLWMVRADAGQTFRFVREFKVGDRVLSYDPSERVYLVAN